MSLDPSSSSSLDSDYGDVDDDESTKMRRLFLWLGVFFATPGLSIGFAFLIFDPADHGGHILLSLAFGFAGVFLALASRRMAEKYQ